MPGILMGLRHGACLQPAISTGASFMKIFLPILLLTASCSSQPGQPNNARPANTDTATQSKPKLIWDSTNTLTGKTENLTLEYVGWGCACANWVTAADRRKYEDSGLAAHCIFIEPADKLQELPLYFDASRHWIKVKGEFYTRPGYPKDMVETEEHIDKAGIFRYSSLEVVDNPGFKPIGKVETKVLDYSAIACTCAQWVESRYTDSTPDERIYYWLEPANNQLLKADQLFNGSNLPVQVRVTGQIVSESGFPERTILAKVESSEAGKVFRYTKIEVLKN
jgi:hypothetical protein